MTVNPLRKHLERNGITQERFATHLRVSRPQLTKLMRGTRTADVDFLAEVETVTEGKVTPNMWVRWWKGLRGEAS